MATNVLALDFTQLRQLTGEDPEFMIDILEIIQEQSPQVEEELITQYENAAWKDLSATAHKYKSSINILGNRDLNQLVHRLEVAGRDEKIEGMSDLIAEFRQVCDLLLQSIESELASLK